MATFTDEEVLRELKRELGMRRRVFARWVERERMTQAEADHRTGIIEQLAAEYEARIRARTPDMFGDPDA